MQEGQAMMAQPAAAHLLCSSQQVFGFVYARNSRGILGACVHRTGVERKLGKELGNVHE